MNSTTVRDINLLELRPLEQNYNRHPDEQIAVLRESLRQFGQVRNIVVWRDQTVAGHGVVEAAVLEQFETLRANVLPDEWPLERVLAYLVADNETARLSDPDEAQLAATLLLVTAYDMSLLAATGVTEEQLEELLAQTGTGDGAGGDDEDDESAADALDRAEEIRAQYGVEFGQVWTCGPHLVVCGDSRDPLVQQALLAGGKPDVMLTDPPYGISVVGNGKIGGAKEVTIAGKAGKVGGGGELKFSAGKVGGGNIVQSHYYRPVAGDDEPFEPEYLLPLANDHILFGGNYFASRLPDSRCWLIWDKQNTGNFADAELAWTSFQRGVKLYQWLWNGLARAGERGEEGVSRIHPTQKPVGLFKLIISDFVPDGATVIDPYLGSGTTLLAAARVGRRCVASELDPAYVAVAIDRWAKLTGQTPSLLETLDLSQGEEAKAARIAAIAERQRRPLLGKDDVPDGLYPSNNDYGIPMLRIDMQAEILDLPVLKWGDQPRHKKLLRAPGTVHFYTEDYKFNALWGDPTPVVNTGAVTVVEPNFSIYRITPRAQMLWQLYRKRWLARFWQDQGLRVLVDINVFEDVWADDMLLGVPRGWRAYATRGYSDWREHTIAEYQLACRHAESDNILFVVFGGGKAVQRLAQEQGWVWVPENMHVAEGRVTPLENSEGAV